MHSPELGHPIGDGVICLRPPTPEDTEVLIGGRDSVFHRFMGDGDPEPQPLACITVDGVVVGWIDYDSPRPWLGAGEVNVGYNVFPEFRGNGYATRALDMLVGHLGDDPAVVAATLLIDPDNEGSIGVAHRAGFVRHDDVDGERFYKRSTSGPDAESSSESVGST